MAVKKIYSKQPEKLQREYKQLMRAQHKNIIFLYGVAFNDDAYYLVMEYSDGGSLFNLLHFEEKPAYKFDHAINWSYQTVEVWSNTVIHRFN